jgi:hypothetical protein
MSTLTDDQIKAAANTLSKNVPDSSVAGEFLQKAEISCKSISYTAATARANRQLVYLSRDRYGIPSIPLQSVQTMSVIFVLDYGLILGNSFILNR